MPYQSSGYQSAAQRDQYEDLGQGSSNGGKMQTMEILSGNEYGSEFDESSGGGGMAKRLCCYGLVAFIILIVVLVANPVDTDHTNANFKLPKNAVNNTSTSSQQAEPDEDTTIPPTTLTTTVAPKEEEEEEEETTTPPKPDTTTPPKEQTDNAEEGEWVVTSAPEAPESPTKFYDEICDVPVTYRVGADHFTYLNASDFCLSKDQMVNEDRGCHCLNPVVPVQPDYLEKWTKAFNLNIELVNKAIERPSQLDVVFLGDSITEHWNGRDMGELRDKDHNVSVVFDELFNKDNGASLEGLALGVAGDRTQNVLYRLQHGEMPPALNPKVWWINIGTNNLGGDNCNGDAITVGNIRIVEEIRKQYAKTPIVLNSLLPRGKEELLRVNKFWPVLQKINYNLECYAGTHDNLHFFNATAMFIDSFSGQDYGTEYFVNETLMHDYLHPSGEGSMLWGQAIIEDLNKIIAKEEGG